MEQKPKSRLIFDPESLAKETSLEDVRPSINAAISGYNSTIFVYGYSKQEMRDIMMSERDGILPRLVETLFDVISNNSEVSLQYVEIDQDQVSDLLSNNHNKILIRDDHPSSNSVHLFMESDRSVGSPTSLRHVITSPQEALALVRRGVASWNPSSTRMNSSCTHSHMIISIFVQGQLPNGTTRTGTIHYVDLAGKERLTFGSSGVVRKQCIANNQALSALGDVLNAISRGSKNIPYRRNKLTHLLKGSLGGSGTHRDQALSSGSDRRGNLTPIWLNSKRS